MKLAINIILILFSQASFAQALWADGACNGGVVNEGATREYFNRGTGLRWINHLGDWRDKNNIPQGTQPYNTFGIPNIDKEQTLNIDVTNLVTEWITKKYPNQGFLIQRLSGGATGVYSQENAEPAKAAQLKITTSTATYNFNIHSDTYLNGSTYRCLGNRDSMSTSGNMLFYFDLSEQNISGAIQSAQLQLKTLEKQYGTSATLAIYRAAPSYQQYEVEQRGNGLAAQYPNDYAIQNDDRVYLSEPFEKNDWGNKWTFGADKETLSLISGSNTGNPYTSLNNAERFTPLQGKALQAQLPEGALTALNLNYVFENETGQEPDEVYFRYYIRFGDSWQTIEGGKLPGIAGTYGGEKYAGGWGGRTSNGTNGWSARGIYRNLLQSGNPHSGKIPIGNYLYHADMEGYYGDVVYWDGDDKNALEKNRWYALEQYVKLNTPGKNDGILRAWIDGHPVYEDTSLSFRNEGYEHIKIEKIWMNIYHGGTTPIDKTINVYIDNVVIASDYIGPLVIDPDLPTAGNEPNQLPKIQNTLPEEEFIQINLNEVVEFSAEIFDADGDLAAIKWFKNGLLVGENQFTYSFTPSMFEIGKHLILVEATDQTGAVAFHEWEVELSTNNIAVLPVSQDTYIEKSSYKSVGYTPYVKSRGTMYFRLPSSNNIDVDDITAARLVLFDEKQYGEVTLSTYASDDTWSEGEHNRDGATREYKDYQSRLKWNNYLGDWTDAKGVKQGNGAFDQNTLNKFNEARFVELDVTRAVKRQWHKKNLNIALRSNGINHSFASVNHLDPNKRPSLMLTLNGLTPPELAPQPSPDIIADPTMLRGNNIATLAASANPGQWSELTTNGFSRELLKVQADDKYLHIAGWTDDAMWDANNKQLLFMGFRRNLKMLTYSQVSNRWQEITPNIEWPIGSSFGHVYGNNAFNGVNGIFYHHAANTSFIYQYDTESDEWSTLPKLPIEQGELGTSIEYFPELGGVVRVARSGVQLFSDEKQEWQQLRAIKDMGYHSLVRYNPVRQEILVAGGNYAPNQFAIINKQGDVQYLTDITYESFPAQNQTDKQTFLESLKMSIRADKLLVHPTTGHYLIFSQDKLFDFDSDKQVITEITDFATPFNNYDKPFTTTISEEGVVMFVDKQVLLYKPHKITATAVSITDAD